MKQLILGILIGVTLAAGTVVADDWEAWRERRNQETERMDQERERRQQQIFRDEQRMERLMPPLGPC